MLPGKLIEFSLELVEHWVRPDGLASEQQLGVLKRLIKEASKTEFGLFYNFKSILRSKQLTKTFQSTIPFHDYNQLYDKWWHRTLAGVPDVTWKGKVDYFALSSGTSNATSKRIPITNTMFKMLRQSALRIFTSLPAFDLPENIYTKSWLGIGGTSRLDKVDGHFEGYLSGINTRKRPFWARAFYRPGDKITQITDFNMRTDIISIKAKKWDVGLIIGIPHWVQLTLEQILENNKINTINEIWPHLRVFITGGVDYRPYQNAIDKLVGHPLTYINTYLASEGMIAYQIDPWSKDLQLILDGGIFFEFIPFNETNFDGEGNLVGAPQAFTIDRVQLEKEYAMIISTCSGAWRYLLGDTVRFTDISAGKIVIAGRTKYYLNLCSEHLTGDNMTAAISRAEETFGIIITEFTIAPIRKGNFFEHRWFVGVDQDINRNQLKTFIDNSLKERNDDYKSERETALSMNLNIVPTAIFYEWQQKTKAAGQSKIPRVIRGPIQKSWFQFLREKNELEGENIDLFN